MKNWIPKYVIFIFGVVLTPLIAGVLYVHNLVQAKRGNHILEIALFVFVYSGIAMYGLQSIDLYNWTGILVANAIGSGLMTEVLWPRHMKGLGKG